MAVVELGWVQGAVRSVEGSKMEKPTYRLRIVPFEIERVI